MTKLIAIFVHGLAGAALATCGLAHRVLALTGTTPPRLATDHPPGAATARHGVPPIE